LILPLFEPYIRLQRSSGFSRSLDEARAFSATWRAYITSSARAHAWLQSVFGKDKIEVAFPGFIAVGFGLTGLAVCLRAATSREREIAVLYGTLFALALWASFGPGAGLYTVLYHTVPAFTLMRAPARFALVVSLTLAVLSAFGVQALMRRSRKATIVAWLVALAAAGELVEVLRFPQAGPFPAVYRQLASLPRGPVIEMPFFWPEVGLFRHSEYMLNSTVHWMPLINGYSDYIPPDFLENVRTLAGFPSREGLKLLEPSRARYALFHRRRYNSSNWRDISSRLTDLAPYFREVYVDGPGTLDEIRLYEIVGFPQ
jgi:hypothetical protein